MKRLHKATPPAVLDAIPLELRSIPRWIVWDYCDYGEAGKKPRKVPLTPGRDVGANYTDPAVWRPFDDVLEEARRRGGLGIGFVFSEDDDLVGVDLDDAIAAGPIVQIVDEIDDPFARGRALAERLKPWAKEIFDRFETWAEASPSGSGVHFVGRGERIVGKSTAKISETERVERYSQLRWFTFSGDVMKPGPVADVREAMAWLAARHFAPPAAAPAVERPASTYAPDPELDVELARVCLGYLRPERAFEGDDWRRVGYSLKGTSESLSAEWHSFSRQWAKYEERECSDRWARFNPGTAGVQTLVGMACDDSGKTARDLIEEARRRLGRPSASEKPAGGRPESPEELDFRGRLEAVRPGVEASGLLCLTLTRDPSLALYRECGIGTADDVAAAPELTRALWGRVAKTFPGARVQLVAGDLGDEAFRNSCRALLETRFAPEAVVVIGPEAWQGEDDLPGFVDVHGVAEAGLALVRHGKPAAVWLADDALRGLSPADPDTIRREAVDRVLDAVAACRGPRAALDVEDLILRASESTGYSREALEGLALKARERAEERRLREALGRELAGLAAEAEQGKTGGEDLLDRTREALEKISSRSAVVPLTPAFDVEAVEREAKLVRPGFSTGWSDLDLLRVRLRPKELVALAARPSQGKTSTLVWLLWQLLEQVDDGAVVFVTHEETRLSLLYRLYALAAAFLVPDETELSKYAHSRRWNRGDVRDWLADSLEGVARHGVTKEKIELLARAKELVVEKTRRLVVIEERGAGADRVAKLCRAIHDAHGCRGVLLDYLQRLPHDGPDLAKGRRDLETAWACRRLREGIALPFECPVVIAAQVNREALRDGWARRLLAALDPDKKGKKIRDDSGEELEKQIREVERVLSEARPAPHMLRDGGIEHEADLILGTHNPAADLAWCKEKKRDFVNRAWPRNPTPLDIGVLKNRSGTDGEWFRLLGDYGAGHFTSGSGSPAGEAEAGSVPLSDWQPADDDFANPFG